jgi:hypothetical protein
MVACSLLGVSLLVLLAPLPVLPNDSSSSLQQRRAQHVSRAAATSCQDCLAYGGVWGLHSHTCWQRQPPGTTPKREQPKAGEEGLVSSAGGGAMSTCPDSEREARWHYEYGARRWAGAEEEGNAALTEQDAPPSADIAKLLSCADNHGILVNSTAYGTVKIGGDDLPRAVLDTAARAAARVAHCGAVALRWDSPGVLRTPGGVLAGVRRSVLSTLGLSGVADASVEPPGEKVSAKDFLLSDHESRGRDRYEMVLPFGKSSSHTDTRL